jgi:hypothetical protein
MPLTSGARLGPYEILAPLGAGGMSEVYRARDTRLDRVVAIKVLPSHLAADGELRDRFDREARAISALNHPHICALYDIGHQDGTDDLVLEYLEGETLAQRLAQSHDRRLAVSDALSCAIQIADALDKAHRSGIVHRDLKPANVMLTKTGAKLLDFGLAKTAAPVVATTALSMLPTTPPVLTAQGTILGTFQYMAPEQIEGLEADTRTDIFAFGAVLFEMLTGRTAFEGKTRARLLGAILKDVPPPVTTLQPLAPRALDRIVSTCLEKDPDNRWQTARDLLRELKWVASSGESDTAAAAATPTRFSRPSRAAWAVAAVFGIALLVAAVQLVRQFRAAPPAAEPITFTIAAPDNSVFGGPPGGGTGQATQLAVSPDGRHIVFVAATHDTFRLWLRPVGTLASRPIPGTEDGSFPFWSPDSRFVGFFAGGKLKKVLAAGEPPIVLCDAPAGRGGTWNAGNVIVFAPAAVGPLQRVSGTGGIPVPLTTLDSAYGETNHRYPHFLPDGTHFLYTAVTGAAGSAPKPSRIKIGALGLADARTLVQAESSAAYASGHLLFVRDGTLMAQPFDAAANEAGSEAFPVAEQLSTEPSRYASFSVSATGVLAFAHGVGFVGVQLTWFDRAGKSIGTVGDVGLYSGIALSPDESRVAVSLATGSPLNRDIWILGIAQPGNTRLTFDPGDDIYPVWSPDGSQIAYGRLRSGIHETPAAGNGNDRLLLPVASESVFPTDWSRDGQFIVYTQTSAGRNGFDVWILPLSGDRKPFPFVQTPFIEDAAAFRRTATGSRTYRTKPVVRRCSSSRFPRLAANTWFPGMAAHNPCGAVMAGSCFS